MPFKFSTQFQPCLDNRRLEARIYTKVVQIGHADGEITEAMLEPSTRDVCPGGLMRLPDEGIMNGWNIGA